MTDKTEKNEVNLKVLAAKAAKNEKTFLYYENSKTKINTIIRKNKLDNYINNYLWQSNIYKKEIVRYQTLSPEIRENILICCSNGYAKSPWTSILVNFLKYHSPTEDEIKRLVFLCDDNIEKITTITRRQHHISMILDCWSIHPETCHKIEADSLLYNAIIGLGQPRNEHDMKRIVSTTSYIIKNIPDMRITLIDNIFRSQFNIKSILAPALKSIYIDDNVVSYLMSKADAQTFKYIVKNAIHRDNVSEYMIAKIYLAID